LIRSPRSQALVNQTDTHHKLEYTNNTATYTTIHILILIPILMGELIRASWLQINYSGTLFSSRELWRCWVNPENAIS
jgi:hypothetical protein